MTDYALLQKEIRALAEEARDHVPLLANVSALLFEALPDLNWAGFYLMDEGSLVVGPFQGKVACVRIPVGKGVCGTAVLRDETVRVADVHAFPGHIACDGASASEIVIPIHENGEVVGVLDIDSPLKERFTKEDQEGLEGIVRVLEETADFSRLRRKG